MPKKSESKIEKEVDKAQDKIEKIELKEIQKDYKKNVPAFIWILKILIVVDIIVKLIEMFTDQSKIIINLIGIILEIILIFALFKRRRWGWYFGLILFLIGAIFSFLLLQYFGFLLYVIFIILLAMHKDYLNK